MNSLAATIITTGFSKTEFIDASRPLRDRPQCLFFTHYIAIPALENPYTEASIREEAERAVLSTSLVLHTLTPLPSVLGFALVLADTAAVSLCRGRGGRWDCWYSLTDVCKHLIKRPVIGQALALTFAVAVVIVGWWWTRWLRRSSSTHVCQYATRL